MIYLAKDEALFELIKNGKIALRDSKIKRINVFIEEIEGFEGSEVLYIEIDFADRSYLGQYLRFRFSGINEFSFYHHYTHNFRYVENFTLLKHENQYYFSFDPEDERSLTISENDQDIILFENFEASMVEPFLKG
ncbi:MAG: hypothetical protein V4592_01930 [Bacteroidota bacterium]